MGVALVAWGVGGSYGVWYAVLEAFAGRSPEKWRRLVRVGVVLVVFGAGTSGCDWYA